MSVLDLGCCLPSTAERLVAESEQIERLGQAIKTLAAARVIEAGAWDKGGARSPEDWLATTTGTSIGDAADTITTGRQLNDLAATKDALCHGRLSRRQAKAVADAASADPSAEGRLLDRAAHGSLGELQNDARRTKAAAAGIGHIPVSVVNEWMDDAFIAAVLTDGEDVTKVVHLGRRFTAKQRTALQWRDPECCVQGCTNTLRLEYDHHQPWADTRITTVGSADRLCKLDHRRKTAGWHLAAADAHGKQPLLAPDHPEHPVQRALRSGRASCGADPPLAG